MTPAIRMPTMHQPEQRLTDYKAQKATREAPIIALLSTVMVGVLSSVVASTLAVRGFIGQYVPNFFPDYFPWHLGTMPLYTPWAMWKAYDQFYQYPMPHPFFATAGVTVATTLGIVVHQLLRSGKGDLRHNVHTWRPSLETGILYKIIASKESANVGQYIPPARVWATPQDRGRETSGSGEGGPAHLSGPVSLGRRAGICHAEG